MVYTCQNVDCNKVYTNYEMGNLLTSGKIKNIYICVNCGEECRYSRNKEVK